MFKPVQAKSIMEYFDNLPRERRRPMEFLHTFIQKTVPSLKPNFVYNMPGYGSFKYKNYKNEVIDWPTVALASQKNYISIYVCSVVDGEYIAEKNKKNLGNVNVGKSCIRFKKIEDLNLEKLQKVLKLAEKNPGLVGVGRDHK